MKILVGDHKILVVHCKQIKNESEVEVVDYIIIEKGKDGAQIGRLLNRNRGKVIFVNHLPNIPSINSVCRVELVEEREKWGKAKSLELAELMPALWDEAFYPSHYSDFKISIGHDAFGKIVDIQLTVYRRWTYKDEVLKKMIKNHALERPTYLDKDETYQCPVSGLDFTGDGVILKFASPVETISYLGNSIPPLRLDELEENVFVENRFNEILTSAKTEKKKRLEAHQSWWQNLPENVKAFFIAIEEGEWWKTDDGRFLSHSPLKGSDCDSIRISADIAIMDKDLGLWLLEKISQSRKMAEDGVGYCEIFTKTYDYNYNNLAISIAVLVDTDGEYGYGDIGHDVIITIT